MNGVFNVILRLVKGYDQYKYTQALYQGWAGLIQFDNTIKPFRGDISDSIKGFEMNVVCLR
jgi:hypothetical protein